MNSCWIQKKKMSLDKNKNKENPFKYCIECHCQSSVEHVCSSQLLSDSVSTLSQMAHEQLNLLERFSLSEIHLKCEEDLERWHLAAVHHLQEIFNQRLNDLNDIFTKDIQPDLHKYRLQMIEFIEKNILSQINLIIKNSSSDKAQRIQNVLNEMKCEYDTIVDKQWLNIQLPDLKHFSVPIRIAKMALAARLTDGEKDPLEDLSDEENEKNARQIQEKKKKRNSIEILDIFASNPEPFQIYLLESNSSTLAFSNTHLLIHDNKKLILFDLKKKVQEFPWNDNDYGILVDICWMNSLALFVILTIHSVYLYDPLKPSPIKVESIKALDRSHVLASLSTFDRDLYINYHKGVHIDQYRVSPTLEWIFEKRYSKLECCESSDIGIRDVRCDNEYICFSIMQGEDFKWRLDLMSRDMVRVRRGVAMDAGENHQKFFSMLIPLQDQRWLFVNWFTNKLWIVDQQGKTRLIKETKIKNIRNISISSDSTFMAIRTEKPSALKIYKLD